MLMNGGSLFAFSEPFVVTEASAGTAIQMDPVFNPEGFELASSVLGRGDAQACDHSNQLGFDMPFVRMNPVPRKAGEETCMEAYLVDCDTSSCGSVSRAYTFEGDVLVSSD